MSQDKILKCLIAFVLGYFVARMMRGNGMSVGGDKVIDLTNNDNIKHIIRDTSLKNLEKLLPNKTNDIERIRLGIKDHCYTNKVTDIKNVINCNRKKLKNDCKNDDNCEWVPKKKAICGLNPKIKNNLHISTDQDIKCASKKENECNIDEMCNWSSPCKDCDQVNEMNRLCQPFNK
tara:strand:- start:20 stop:547 length:528 start_codon:yes stop_codon:yes gene_type:complete